MTTETESKTNPLQKSSPKMNIESMIQSAILNWHSAVQNYSTTPTPTPITPKRPVSTPTSTSTSTPASNNTPPKEESSSYEQRLQTFQIQTYFAKPFAISPLICARFG